MCSAWIFGCANCYDLNRLYRSNQQVLWILMLAITESEPIYKIKNVTDGFWTKRIWFYSNIFNIIIGGTIDFHRWARIFAFVKFVQNQHHFLLIEAQQYLFDIICSWDGMDWWSALGAWLSQWSTILIWAISIGDVIVFWTMKMNWRYGNFELVDFSILIFRHSSLKNWSQVICW